MKETPATAMRHAYDTEVSLWRVLERTEPDGPFAIVRYRNGFAEYDIISSALLKDCAYHEMRILAKEEGHRAALCALAEVTPTETMIEAAEAAHGWDIVKAGILAAASGAVSKTG